MSTGHEPILTDEQRHRVFAAAKKIIACLLREQNIPAHVGDGLATHISFHREYLTITVDRDTISCAECGLTIAKSEEQPGGLCVGCGRRDHDIA